MLNTTPMKSLLVFSFIIFSAAEGKSQPIAQAGSDQTIYLTQTSTAKLDGSKSSGDSYQWSKMYDVVPEQATNPVDPAKITSPSSPITTVTGLIQGVWYYQLSVTKGGITKKDTVIVRVDYDVPPVNATLLAAIPISAPGFVAAANNRVDTTNYLGYAYPNYYDDPITLSRIFFERSRSNGAMVDSSRGKLYNTIEDGYEWNNAGYARSQLVWNSNTTTPRVLDSNKTYVLELKFLFPQPVKGNILPNKTAAIFGIHGGGSADGNFSLQLWEDSLTVYDVKNKKFTKLMSTDDSVVNKAHTMRMTLKEGMKYPGQTACCKIEIDGVQKFYQNNEQIGSLFGFDYPKLTGLYDYHNVIVNPDSLTRHKSFSIVTEAMNWWVLNNNISPIANAGKDQKFRK